jgi:hypothetical protein
MVSLLRRFILVVGFPHPETIGRLLWKGKRPRLGYHAGKIVRIFLQSRKKTENTFFSPQRHRGHREKRMEFQ